MTTLAVIAATGWGMYAAVLLYLIWAYSSNENHDAYIRGGWGGVPDTVPESFFRQRRYSTKYEHTRYQSRLSKCFVWSVKTIVYRMAHRLQPE